MRPTETRLSCLGFLAVLAFGLPLGSSGGAQSPQEGLAGLTGEGDLVAQTRACRDWYAAAARQPRQRDWAKDAQFDNCRQVITQALERLETRPPQAVRGLALASNDAVHHGLLAPRGAGVGGVRSRP